MKLSSLEHAILPSTKVSVHAVDVTLPLKVSVTARPDYPFISALKLSLAEAPECNVRITPLSGERYGKKWTCELCADDCLCESHTCDSAKTAVTTVDYGE